MRILLIEDDETLLRVMQSLLTRKGHTVFCAKTAADAEQIVTHEPGLTAILVDGWLFGEFSDTCALIRRIRRTYSGPMIAMSADSHTRAMQKLAGCNFEVMGKIEAVQFILDMPPTFLQTLASASFSCT